MKAALFDLHAFEQPYFKALNPAFGHELQPFALRLRPETAALAAGFPAVSAFAHDELSVPVLMWPPGDRSAHPALVPRSRARTAP